MMLWISIFSIWAADLCVEPEYLAIPTADGAQICAQHLPQKGHPVILAHGISSNHNFWNLNAEYSLAQYLQKKGFDVYNIDFRGHGHATHSPTGKKQIQGWSIDDYGIDINAIVQHVKKKHPKKKPFYIGHSLGGLAFITYMAQYGSHDIQGAVIVASPFDFRHPEPLLRMARFGSQISIIPIPTPSLAYIASLFHRTPAYIDSLLWGVDTIDHATRREMYQKIVSPMTPRELKQIEKTLSQEAFSPLEGSESYKQNLSTHNIPALFFAGRADRIAPVDRVLGYYNALGSDDKAFVILGKAYGFHADYGHLDYGLSRYAEIDVFPVIEAWLMQKQSSLDP